MALESTNPGSLVRLEVACLAETIPLEALWADKAEEPLFRLIS